MSTSPGHPSSPVTTIPSLLIPTTPLTPSLSQQASPSPSLSHSLSSTIRSSPILCHDSTIPSRPSASLSSPISPLHPRRPPPSSQPPPSRSSPLSSHPANTLPLPSPPSPAHLSSSSSLPSRAIFPPHPSLPSPSSPPILKTYTRRVLHPHRLSHVISKASRPSASSLPLSLTPFSKVPSFPRTYSRRPSKHPPSPPALSIMFAA